MWAPSGRATGLSWARPSAFVSRNPSSRLIVRVSPVGFPSSSWTGTSTGITWVAKRSSAQARAARCWDRMPKASQSARVMSHLSAMRSAPSNWVVNS